jgi:hypothetical protein
MSDLSLLGIANAKLSTEFRKRIYECKTERMLNFGDEDVNLLLDRLHEDFVIL